MSHGGVASSRASHSVAPRLAPERRIGRHRVHPDLADRVLAELAHRHAAADVVDVAQVAVVGALIGTIARRCGGRSFATWIEVNAP